MEHGRSDQDADLARGWRDQPRIGQWRKSLQTTIVQAADDAEVTVGWFVIPQDVVLDLVLHARGSGDLERVVLTDPRRESLVTRAFELVEEILEEGQGFLFIHGSGEE